MCTPDPAAVFWAAARRISGSHICDPRGAYGTLTLGRLAGLTVPLPCPR